MATYEDKIKAVGTKLAMLEFTDKETESVIAKRDSKKSTT